MGVLRMSGAGTVVLAGALGIVGYAEIALAGIDFLPEKQACRRAERYMDPEGKIRLAQECIGMMERIVREHPNSADAKCIPKGGDDCILSMPRMRAVIDDARRRLAAREANKKRYEEFAAREQASSPVKEKVASTRAATTPNPSRPVAAPSRQAATSPREDVPAAASSRQTTTPPREEAPAVPSSAVSFSGFYLGMNSAQYQLNSRRMFKSVSASKLAHANMNDGKYTISDGVAQVQAETCWCMDFEYIEERLPKPANQQDKKDNSKIAEKYRSMCSKEAMESLKNRGVVDKFPYGSIKNIMIEYISSAAVERDRLFDAVSNKVGTKISVAGDFYGYKDDPSKIIRVIPGHNNTYNIYLYDNGACSLAWNKFFEIHRTDIDRDIKAARSSAPKFTTNF